MSVRSFSSVLVANRGEIALRIMRTARAEGLRCIAVHTDADADAPHVRFADQAVRIGDGPVADSYLSIDRILEAARRTGAEAVHPGYGFLSENAGFARACAEAGLVFVGPPAEAIALMGDKAAAKRRMIAAGVACVPGYQGADQSDATLAAEARAIGFPVMIKAAAGGGGRGMRLVPQAQGFADALSLARAEARAAFGSQEMILEKAVERARHVEFQVVADRHGTVLHLGERDCSAQRRHQKVIEEAPCPALTPELRARMGAAAVDVARAIGYEGAGTVEFLLDADGAFYFLEMNTRLQVEHPVTELVTGCDLVALQFAVARGKPLGFAQDDVVLRGHAIEARLYAEDPGNGFLPATGAVAEWRPPDRPGLRVDAGIETGMSISPHYDPLLAKIIAHGATREEARSRLVAALGDTVLMGVACNRDFLIGALSDPVFAAGAATTAFLDDLCADAEKIAPAARGSEIALAAALTYRALQARAARAAICVPPPLLGWSSSGQLVCSLRLRDRDRVHRLTVRDRRGELTISDAGQSWSVAGSGADLRIDGARADLRAFHFDGRKIHIATAARIYALGCEQAEGPGRAAVGSGHVTAPMHGTLLALGVAVGDSVRPGDRLAVLEAMKMQHELVSGVGGQVAAVAASAGDQVRAGDLLIEIKVAHSGP